MMRKKNNFSKYVIPFIVLYIFLSGFNSTAQVYQHNFGTTPISGYPYSVAPGIISPDLSGSVWTNNTGSWVSYLGSGGVGQALGLADSSGASASVTLTFNVAAGKQLTVDSFSFWRQRSNSGAQNWSMTINGINVGSGTIPSAAGASTGLTTVANPVINLSGTVSVVISLSGAAGVGTFRVDDFTLNGTISSSCASITSLSPSSGPANTIVTINGSGFQAGTGTSSVKFNGVEAASFTVVSNTVIKAVVPATATTGIITVVTSGCSTTSAPFTILSTNCPPATAADLYISELYDHVPGSYGVIELYNPTSNTITFNGEYVLERYGDYNGSTASYTLTLSGSLGSEMTYLVLSYGSGVLGCPVATNATMGAGINDNDEFKLVKNGTVIDISRAPGNTGYTVIRKPDAIAPSVTYNINDWTFTGQNCADLGNHLTTAVPSVSATITVQPVNRNVCENTQTTFSVTIDNPAGFTYQWKVLDTSGNWINVTNGANYSGAATNTLTINPATIALTTNQYYCQITSGTCSLISNAAQLIVNPVPAVANVTVTQPTCTNPTGTITINSPTGPGITYSIDGVNYQNSTTFTGLAPGTYTPIVKNAANCTSTAPTITINPAPGAPAVADVTVTQPTCAVSTGTITINSPTGVGLTYSLDGTAFFPGTTFSGLTPGSYTVTVKNAANCTSTTATITINPVPSAPAVANVTVVQPTCAVSTGTITINTPVGAGLTYNINGIAFQTVTTFAGLAPGTYIVTVKNAANCTSATANIVINPAPGAPAVANVTTIQPTCTVPTGTITINTPVGAGITYSIDGTTFQTSTTFAGLAPGTYIVTVKNAANCTSTTSNIIINPAPGAPAVANVTTVQPTCTTSTGSITINTPVGAGLTYSIDGTTFQTSTIFAGLAPGTYTIIVKNASGCTSTTPIITINPAPGTPAVAGVSTIQPTCTITTGTITINTPIAADLTYSIDGTVFQSSTTFAGLAPGTYTVIVKNTAGCTSTTANIIIDPAPGAPAVADVTITQPTCTVSTGTITINTPVGAGLTYSIDGTAFQASATFAGLAPGTYTVTVKNTVGCTSTTANIVINTVPGAPAVADVTVTQPTCTTPTGTITINTPVGAGLTYSIDGIAFQASATFAGLATGTYTVTVKNAAGCISATPIITINAAPDAPAVADITIEQPACATPTGIITVNEPIGAGLTYSINGTNFQSSTTFAGLIPGTYSVTVKNSEGCTAVTSGIVINDAAGLPLITTTQECKDTTFGKNYILEALPLDNSFDISSATFAWKNEQGNAIGNDENTFDVTAYVAANNIDASDFPIEFTVTVTTPQGCEKSASFTVESYFCNIPKGVSPNNDGKNDSFNLTGLNVKKLSIFNRYGKEVYTKNNYTNEWHGQSNNDDELPTGTYYYAIELSGKESETGWVYINRQE